LALIKRLPEADRATRAGQWAKRNTMQIGDLRGGTLGIVGMGRIGRELVELVRPFESRVIGYDPFLSADEFKRLGVESVTLEGLLERSDFISLHAPLTAENEGLFDRRRLEMCKPGAILVNLARGGLIASFDDLYDCLESGRLSAVGIDVFPQEPPDVSHRLFSHPNALFSPHSTGGSLGGQQAIFEMMCDGMLAVLQNREWPHVANKHLLRSAKESKA
jgi:phosphoglycerate dehydrogenase-like enzyme